MTGQDFDKVTPEHVLELGEKFVDRSMSVETYRTDNGGFKIILVLSITSKPFSEVLDSLGLNKKEIEVANNILSNLSALDYEGNSNIYDPGAGDSIEYPPGSASIPYYNQGDSRWGSHSYGSSTIQSGGCGPTSLAMVVSGLIGRQVTPIETADWAVANGHRAEGAGSYWSIMTAGGAHYDLRVETVSRMNPSKIREALSKGHPVIASMGRGHFTQAGHFIVLRGIAEDGKIIVNDPASVQRSNQTWDLSLIMSESSTNEGVNGSPFWIFSK